MNRRLRLAPAALIATCALVAVACGQKAGVHVASGGVTRNAAGQTVDASGNVIDNGTGGTGAGTATGGSPSGGTSGGTSTGGATSSGSTSGGSTSGGGGGAAAGGAANRTGVTDTEIVIGIHAPATGAGAPAPSFNAGKDVYFNFAGPVNGRKVRVVFADDGYNPGQAVSACKKLVQVDHVFMLLGGGGTDQIVACAQYAASVGVPYMAEGVTEQGLSKLPSYFALAMSYKQQGTLLAQYIKNVLHKTKVAMVRGNTANFEDAHSGFVQAAQAAGLTMVKDLSINKDASPAEATNAAQQVCTSVAPGTSPDLVVYPLMSPKVFIQFAGAASQQQCFPRYAGVGVTLGLNVVQDRRELLLAGPGPGRHRSGLRPRVQEAERSVFRSGRHRLPALGSGQAHLLDVQGGRPRPVPAEPRGRGQRPPVLHRRLPDGQLRQGPLRRYRGAGALGELRQEQVRHPVPEPRQLLMHEAGSMMASLLVKNPVIARPIVQGLANGAGFGLVAVGIVLIYKSSRVFNFAAGEFVTLGAFGTYLADFYVPFGIAMLIGVLTGTVAGLVTERLVVRPLANRPKVTILVATVAIAFIVIPIEIIRSSKTQAFAARPIIHGNAFQIFRVFVSWQQLIIVVVLLAVGAAMAYFFNQTDLGLATLASSASWASG